MLLNCGVGEDSWESLGLQGDQTSPSYRSVLGVHWKDWCWSWNSNILATWCEELTHLKRPWCWERLRVGGEGDDRGWDGWMASPHWTWSGWTPGVGDGQGGLACCSSWGRKESDMTEWLNWTEYSIVYMYHSFFIHSSVSEHLGCFHVLAIVNNAAMNIGESVSFSVMVFSGYMPSSRIVGLNGSVIPSF